MVDAKNYDRVNLIKKYSLVFGSIIFIALAIGAYFNFHEKSMKANAVSQVCTWNISDIETTGNNGAVSSLAIDQNDKVHLSYTSIISGTESHLVYAYNTGSGWVKETVPNPDTYYGDSNSIAVDSNNRPHITYNAVLSRTLYYSYHDGTNWQTLTVDTDPSFGFQYPSMTLDSNNRPHISYIKYSEHKLKEAYYNGSSWVISDIQTINFPYSISIVSDSSNRSHIFYWDWVTLKEAYFNGSSWIISTVDTAFQGAGPVIVSAKIDNTGKIHLAYNPTGDSGNPSTMKYAYFDGSWHISTVYTGITSTDVHLPMLSLDKNNRPGIIYNIIENPVIHKKYAHFNGSTWDIEEYQAYNSSGLHYAGFGFDSNNYAHISYRFLENSTGYFKYAVRDNCGPQPDVNPSISSVTTPINSKYYNPSTIPSSFTGSSADGIGGTGLNADSTTYTLKRASDNHYWNGTNWDSATEAWLAATNSATANNATVAWTSDTAMPTWVGDETYRIAAKTTNKTDRTLTGSVSVFYFDDTPPYTVDVYDGTVIGVETSTTNSSSSLSANWTASTDPFSGIDHYEYAIGTTSGGTDITNWTSAGTSTSVTKNGLSLTVGGIYYFSVKAVNGAGLEGTASNSSGQTVVDNTPPIVTITTKPNNPTNIITPTFGGNAADGLSNITLIEYKLDDGSWNTVGGPYSTKSVEYSFVSSSLSEGNHTIYVRATDSYENTSEPISYSFTVDTTPPTKPVIKSIQDGGTIDNATPEISGTADPNTTVHLTVKSDPKYYTVLVDSSGKWTMNVPGSDALLYGEHSIIAYASDAAGNNSISNTINFTFSAKSMAVSGPEIKITITISAILFMFGLITIELWYRKTRSRMVDY